MPAVCTARQEMTLSDHPRTFRSRRGWISAVWRGDRCGCSPTQSMDKRAYSFKSSATYRAGAISKRSRCLWLVRRLWLMTREVTFRPLSQTSSPTIKTLRSLETSIWETRRAIGNTLRWSGGSANWTSRYGARQLAAGSLLMTISRLKTPPCESVSLLCLLCDEASACGAENRPSWRPISFSVSERLRRQGLQAALHRVRSFAWYRLEAKPRPRVPRPRSTYMEPSGAYRHAHYSDGPFFHPMDAIRHNRYI